MKLSQKKLRKIIKEELTQALKENTETSISSTLVRVRQKVTEELEKKGMNVNWTTEGKQYTFGGQKVTEYQGSFTHPEYEHGHGTIVASGKEKIRTGQIWFTGGVYYSSGRTKKIADGEEFVNHMVKEARAFKFPVQLRPQ